MIVLSCFVFAIVIVMFGYAIWKFRVKPGDESDGKPIHGNTKLEIAWTVIPTIIVLFGAGYSWVVLDDIEAKAADRDAADVIGQQFKWTFEYPEKIVGTGDGGDAADDERAARAGRPPARHHASSALDVLHSFWVPEWGIKRDRSRPDPGGEGIDNQFVVTPDREGTFSLVCTELCGIGHATMRATVVVESQEEFDAVARRAGGGAGGARRAERQRADGT